MLFLAPRMLQFLPFSSTTFDLRIRTCIYELKDFTQEMRFSQSNHGKNLFSFNDRTMSLINPLPCYGTKLLISLRLFYSIEKSNNILALFVKAFNTMARWISKKKRLFHGIKFVSEVFLYMIFWYFLSFELHPWT